MRNRALALVPLLALILAAGCGGGGGKSANDAASVVPANALAYVTVDTDLSSAQLASAKTVLDKFPLGPTALTQITRSLGQGGLDVSAVASSIGSVLDVAVLPNGSSPGAVGFAKPSNPQAFIAQLAKAGGTMRHETVSGWTVFADSQKLLDAVRLSTSSLSSAGSYKDATGTIPATGDAIVRAYVSGAALQAAVSGAAGASSTLKGIQLGSSTKWVSAALTAKSGAVRLEVHAKQASSGGTAGASLADQIPTGSIAALSLTGGTLSLPASAAGTLGSLTKTLGIDLSGLLKALSGPVIVYVRPGVPLPELTIAAKPADPAGALTAIGGLLGKALGASAKPTMVTVGGVQLEKIALGPVALYAGVVDGELLITDSQTAVGQLKGGGSKLSGDTGFKDAASAAGMPQANQGFLYLDVKDTLPLVDGLATLASVSVPPAVEANLKPVSSVLVYGSRAGDVQTLVAYLQTS